MSKKKKQVQVQKQNQAQSQKKESSNIFAKVGILILFLALIGLYVILPIMSAGAR